MILKNIYEIDIIDSAEFFYFKFSTMNKIFVKP